MEDARGWTVTKLTKLCAGETLDEIDALKGRFVTVLPRSRNEDRQFRKRIQDFVPPWEKVRDRPNPRRKGLARDVWYVYRHPVPSAEAWPVTWVYGKLLEKKQRKRRQDRIEAASAALGKLNEKLLNPRSKRAHRRERVEEAAEKIVRRYKVKKYLSYWSYDFDVSKFRQDGPGRPGQGTLYRKETEKRYAISFEINTPAVEYDKKSDGMYPLLSNDRELTAREVFEAHKRQPKIEKRFQQLKSVHEIAPVYLKNEARIEAFFLVYFLALLVQALLERELRSSLKKEKVESLPIYPEERQARHPTAELVFRLFTHVNSQALTQGSEVLKRFPPELTPLQIQVLDLLGVPRAGYGLQG